MPEATVEAGPCGPALTGTEKEALLQAMRNIWPILGNAGRLQAIAAVKKIEDERF